MNRLEAWLDRPGVVYMLVVAAAVLPYLSLLDAPLIYDGPITILENPAVQAGSLAELFSVDFWGIPADAEYASRSYRPLVSLSYALQARSIGNSVTLYHATDMLLHACASMLVVLCALRLGLRAREATLAGLLFAVHPVQTDAVASAVGRADLMAVLALLAAFALHWHDGERAALRRALAALLLGAALLCKEYAVAFPLILAGCDLALWAAGRIEVAELRRRAGLWVAGLLLLAAYVALRVELFGGLGGVPMLVESDHPLVGRDAVVRWATAASILPLALRLLVLPLGLNHHYRFGTLPVPEGFGDPLALFGLALGAALLAGAVWRIRARRVHPAIFALLLFGVLGPSLNLFGVSGVLFAERFLYLPVAGLGWMLGALLQCRRGAPGAARWATIAAAIVLLAFTVGTVARVEQWSSYERLLRSSLRHYPNGSEVWTDLGRLQQGQDRVDEAARSYERALEINPDHARTWSHYAETLATLGRTKASADALFRAGLALHRDGADEQARLVLARAMAIDTGLLRRRYDLATERMEARRYDEAELGFREILVARPDHAPSWFNLGLTLRLAGRSEQAAEALQRGLDIAEDATARALLQEILSETSGK
jgi:tetratricopeptide (TPR) repeat protein